MTTPANRAERWQLDLAGERHEVVITDAVLRRRIVWTVDGEEVAVKKTSDERVALVADGHGSIALHFTMFGGARQVSWFKHDNEVAALAAGKLLVGGHDLAPEPGSKAAKRLAWMGRHPRLYTARQTAIAVGGVFGALLGAWLAARLLGYFRGWLDWLNLPQIRLPRVPWPEIDIPWPAIDWPDIPWPDFNLPGWVGTALDVAKYAGIVLIALVVAVREVRRQRARLGDKPRPDTDAERQPPKMPPPNLTKESPASAEPACGPQADGDNQ